MLLTFDLVACRSDWDESLIDVRARVSLVVLIHQGMLLSTFYDVFYFSRSGLFYRRSCYYLRCPKRFLGAIHTGRRLKLAVVSAMIPLSFNLWQRISKAIFLAISGHEYAFHGHILLHLNGVVTFEADNSSY